MFKIQKILNYILLNTKERDVIQKYHEIKGRPYDSIEDNYSRQLDKLNKLLNHSFKHVPYYKKIFLNADIVKNGRICLESIEELSKLDFLSKDIIRKEKAEMYSDDINRRKSYKNSSGGSTGEPVIFLQDRFFLVNNHANFHIVKSWRGAGLYDSAILLWGAERDTFKGVKSLKDKVKDFILNIIRLNTFTLDEINIKRYIEVLNKNKPTLIIAYIQSIYEIAKFVKIKKIKVEKQNAIHAAAGTVHDFMKDEVEDVFKCKLFNHYGSREIGSIASECSTNDGLHILMENVLVELVGKDGNICNFGEEGEIVVTTLNNFSMPLIRYKIGDIGIMKRHEKCGCGCSYPKFQKVVGRKTELFKTILGSIVMPEYFIHLIGVVCNPGSIKMFQVVQEKLDLIVVKIVKDGEISKNILSEIEDKIKIVMGDDCCVEFKFVDNIPKTKTGKYLYTFSNV